MGKYSHLKDRFTRYKEEPTHQEKVDQFKKRTICMKHRSGSCECKERAPFNELSKVELAELIKQYGDVKDQYEERIKKINVAVEALNQILLEQLENEEITKFSSSVGTVSIKDSLYPVVVDRRKFLNWIRETNQEELLNVNYQTMKAIISDLALAGRLDELPPGIDVYFRSSIGIYARSKNNKGEEQ